MRRSDLKPLDSELVPAHSITVGNRIAGTWAILHWEPMGTVGWPAADIPLRALTFALVESLPSEALPEAVRKLEEIDRYYAMPIDVTPKFVRTTARMARSRSKERPVLDLTEG